MWSEWGTRDEIRSYLRDKLKIEIQERDVSFTATAVKVILKLDDEVIDESKEFYLGYGYKD